MNLSIILDNAGGVIIKAGQWAGYWSDASDAAETLAALLDGAGSDGWESDEDAMSVECSDEKIRSGGCQELSATSWEDLLDLLDKNSGWTSETRLRARLLEIRGE